MGVPSFYKWLIQKYPKIVVPSVDVKGQLSSDPNPNGMEFDNLYLDMNGIIHPCFHPEDDELFPPNSFDEVFENVFNYIDRIFKIVRPRKLLYMAIDGVAPRAKMNQQRCRRFRSDKDAEIAEAEEERLRKKFEMEGKKVLPESESETSDRNIITPGTEFMDKLSKALQYYTRLRLNNDPGWKNVKVIFSDANVPGEGEHKIMKFIRLQRNLDGYDPDTRHCLYGLDADLIMLALATHELHFSILREDTKKGSERNVAFEFLNLWTLREYLELDLKIEEPPFQLDLERLIDDFIFICFFMGNDFLPHMPSLEIRENAIDLLMVVYKNEFKSLGGYLVDMQRVEDKKAGYVKLKRIEKFILSVGTYEDVIFKKRLNLYQQMKKKILRELAQDTNDLETERDDILVQAPISKLELNARKGYNEDTCFIGSCPTLGKFDDDDDDDVVKNTKELKRQLKDMIREKGDLFKHGGLLTDKVRLGLHGWRERYYKEKFKAEGSEKMEIIRKEIVKKYAEGLCWVLQYYFYGVRSWTWFYPYYYAPFASDLKGLASVRIKFNMGAPFKPFEQLMGVLPPRSVHALPKVYWHLMTSEESPLKEFYPTSFEVDADGKRHQWQGIVKLPFIEEELLLLETRKLQTELKDEEVRRNSETFDKIFVIKSHSMGGQIESIRRMKGRQPLVAGLSGGMNGFISVCCEDSGLANFALHKGMEGIMEDHVLCALYECPTSYTHILCLHENVTIPEKTVAEEDIKKQALWHEYEGFRPPYRSQVQNRYITGINRQKAASTESFNVREIHKGAGTGFSVGRGRSGPQTSSAQNSMFWARNCAANHERVSLGIDRWVAGRGHGQMESLKKNSGVSRPNQAVNGYQIAPFESSTGQRWAGSMIRQANRRENRPYITSTSAWSSVYSGGTSAWSTVYSGGTQGQMNGFSPSTNISTDGRGNVWRRRDSF